MADKKKISQAERVASAQHDKMTKKSAPKKSEEKESKVTVKGVPKERQIPIRVITSVVFLFVFILLLVIFFNPEGALIKLLDGFIHGLVGRVGFVVSIPAFLYLFIIHAFSGSRPVKMRSYCLGSFILLCGCISHLSLNPEFAGDVGVLGFLYNGGIQQSTGGLICGGITMLIEMLFGRPISYILFVVAAILTLLGGMQITVISIIRAIQNRPRAEIDEEPVERPEPATIVVNHIANKHIEFKELQRERRAQRAEMAAQAAQEQQNHAVQSNTDKAQKKQDMFRQIDVDVDEPVAVATSSDPTCNIDQEIMLEKPRQMPPLDLSEAIVEQTEQQAPPVQVEKPKKQEVVTKQDAEEAAVEVADEIEAALTEVKMDYNFPPISLLKQSERGLSDGAMEMRENSYRLNETLASFKIEAHIINVTRGPSVTRYEVELQKGVRLNKLTAVADDIALSLGATGVRIAAIPGKISVVGIEVPNRAVTMVSLRDVIDSQEFTGAKSKSSFAVGKDIGGNCIVGNIARLPHMLIAGTTGSGKSVCMNSIIISLLYKASPDDVKLIMVDPKMVELGIYNGIPHLLIPVVTDPKKAAGSLQWAVSEMMRRYKAMSDAGVRDLESYNSIVESQETDARKLPQVVVIIDELADLMLVAAKEVEESICRIAQMGRAAGIHLIIATQRPSADVITGLMKANIPSRIAFSVASAMESRIILDTQGAEKLVGKGDMLYAPIGNGKPKRVQGCFVSDPEVEAVATYVKENFKTNYDQEVIEEIERKAMQAGSKAAASDPEPNSDEMAGDEMLPAAVDVILETGQASVSMLQRRLKLGYARAARIVDEMEERGIVGPFQGSKPRDILITKEQWAVMRNGGTAQMNFDDLEDDDSAVPEDF